AMLRDNADRDSYVRHGGVMALQHLAAMDKKVLEKAAGDESASVRLAALLVMRRTKDAGVAKFLNDPEKLLVEEAARAVNDELIEGGVPALAGIIKKEKLSRPVWLRA